MKTTVNTPEQLGKALRQYRKDKGKTQTLTGATVGLLPKTVSALENDPGRSQVKTLFKLLSALELDLIVSPKQPSDPSEW